jgi:hypothetical protein
MVNIEYETAGIIIVNFLIVRLFSNKILIEKHSNKDIGKKFLIDGNNRFLKFNS